MKRELILRLEKFGAFSEERLNRGEKGAKGGVLLEGT